MELAKAVSRFNRIRKYNIFKSSIGFTEQTRILDVGFSDAEYSTTDNFLERNYPYPQNITALGIDTPKEFTKRYPLVKVVTYDGNVFPFEKDSFDICWSNAVLEHVGDFEKQLDFIKEIKKASLRSFITTPNKYFPFEVHTGILLLHFLPKKMFDKYLDLVNKKWAKGSYMNLLSLNDIKRLLSLAKIKDYKIIKNKIFFLTLDYVIIF